MRKACTLISYDSTLTLKYQYFCNDRIFYLKDECRYTIKLLESSSKEDVLLGFEYAAKLPISDWILLFSSVKCNVKSHTRVSRGPLGFITEPRNKTFGPSTVHYL